MLVRCLKTVRFGLCLGLVLALLAPPKIQAQATIVQPWELKAAMVKAAEVRQANLDQVNSFFSSKVVRAVFSDNQVDFGKIQHAVSSLNNEDLTMLAQRTQAVQKEFAGGAMSNEQLTYVVIALATAVLILVIVR